MLKGTKRIEKVESYNIPVVTEEYVDAVKKGGAKLMLTQYAIAPWGGEVQKKDNGLLLKFYVKRICFKKRCFFDPFWIWLFRHSLASLLYRCRLFVVVANVLNVHILLLLERPRCSRWCSKQQSWKEKEIKRTGILKYVVLFSSVYSQCRIWIINDCISNQLILKFKLF